jgi:DNA polymerase-3 subunit epsilon
MKYLNKLTKKLKSKKLPKNEYKDILSAGDTFFDNNELETELLISNGYPIFFDNNYVYLKTTTNLIKDQVFCIVDIETTAGNPDKGQLLEIAAIKYKNGQIIEKHESLVNCFEIPSKVEEITGISLDMTRGAPNITTVLEEFKIFLEDDIFVAHNLSFDYKFINDSFEKYNLGKLCNRGLCTINLAHKTIEAERYGLKYITEYLGITLDDHHRAMADTMATLKVFEESLKNIPPSIKTAENLIDFSQSNKTLKKTKRI